MLKQVLAWVFLASYAVASQAQSNIIEKGKITSIVVEGNRWVSVFVSGDNNTTLCSGGGRWVIDPNDPMYDRKYSMLMAAASQGKTVELVHVKSATCSNWDAHKIYLVRVYF